jgi:hypothetical protein
MTAMTGKAALLCPATGVFLLQKIQEIYLKQRQV